MGYPMTYQRFIQRNQILGFPFSNPTTKLATMTQEWFDNHSMLIGDARRMEHDQRDASHLADYAQAAGITPEQAKIVLDCLFDGFTWVTPEGHDRTVPVPNRAPLNRTGFPEGVGP